MTVRVSKPAINLREKVSELDKPVGVKGSELMKSETSQEARDLIGTNHKNLFINGDMRIDQRAYGAVSTPSGTGFTSVDRWKAVINPGSKFSMQRKSDGTVPGFPYYMRLTSLAATTLGASQYQLFWQSIECRNIFDRAGFGYADAKHLSLSFWVRSSVPGPFSGALENWGQSRAYVWQVDINNANVWEYKTVHIPPCTDGDWQVTSTNAAYFMFSLGTTLNGTPNSGWVSAQKLGSNSDIRRIGINGATVDLTGCQLEIGRVATEFEHRLFTEELLLCQRYYEKWGESQYSHLTTGTGTGRGMLIGCYSPGTSGVANAARFFGWLPMATPKRTSSPAITENSILVEHTSLGNSSHVTQIGPYMPNNGPGLTIEVNTLGGYGVAGDPYHLSFYKPNTSAGNIPYIAIDSEL